MAKFAKRIEAVGLRKKGMSIRTIAQTLQVSKSSASKWCLNVRMSNKHYKKLMDNKYKGMLIGAATNRNKKLNNIRVYSERAKKQLGPMSKRDILVAGAALYWAEGSKSDSTSGFVFMNSDPKMILFMKKFINNVLEIKDEDITCTIQINKIHELRINKVLKFWSILLKLPLRQFKTPYYVNVKPKKVYENHDQYYGVLRIKVKRSSNLKYYTLGLIESMSA